MVCSSACLPGVFFFNHQFQAVKSSTTTRITHHMLVELHEQKLQSFTEPLSRKTHIMLLSTRRHTTLAEPCEVLMVVSLISSSCTPQFLVDQKCLTGQDAIILTESTVQMCFMDLLLLPQLREVEQVYQWLKKSRKKSKLFKVTLFGRLSCHG